MTSTDTNIEPWAEVRERLAAAEADELRRVANEALEAETAVADLEERVRNGEDVQPGEIEAAEARARHANLRLTAVRRKHARLLEEARVAHRQRVHDALAEMTATDDDSVGAAVKQIAAAVGKLAAAAPPWNEKLARLRAEAVAVQGENDDSVSIPPQGNRRDRVVVDGVELAPRSVTGLIYEAVHDGLAGDWQKVDGGLAEQVRAVAHERGRPERERQMEAAYLARSRRESSRHRVL